jgi:hypothetical protein
MPTDVLKVPGDYLLDARNGNVTINVSNSSTLYTGTVTVLGNLNVVGTQATISTIDSTLKDNIIVLNSGETAAPGITLGYSGLEISRGFNDDPAYAATLLYNETVGNGFWTDPGGNTHYGVFEFKSEGKGSAIRVNAIRIASTSSLNLLGVESGDAMVNVKGQVDYKSRVLDPDDIPNKAYVDQALYSGTDLAKRIQVGNTFMRIADNSILPITDPYYGAANRIYAALGTSTNVVFDLFGTSARIQGITVDNTIISGNLPTDIILQPQIGHSVVIEESLKLVQINTGTVVTPETNIDTLYFTETPGGGGTGLYYVNTNNSDELVSRRKAIIYGIIF